MSAQRGQCHRIVDLRFFDASQSAMYPREGQSVVCSHHILAQPLQCIDAVHQRLLGASGITCHQPGCAELTLQTGTEQVVANMGECQFVQFGRGSIRSTLAGNFGRPPAPSDSLFIAARSEQVMGYLSARATETL
jgi:hypothetical protein